MKKYLIAILTASVLLTIAGAVIYACNVPVFRYALERWPADPYRIVILIDGEPTTDQAAIIETLENSSGNRQGGANAIIKTVDVSDGIPIQWQKLWDSMKHQELPAIAAQFPPMNGLEFAVWSAPLTDENIALLVDSPARKEIANRILDGQSAVWVFVESGDSEKDAEKFAFIKDRLNVMEDELELPDEVEGNESDLPIELSGDSNVRIAFSILSISRNDKSEAAFLALLMHTEPDLVDYIEEPMVFPVFGRGRALYALIGDGMTERNVMGACSFITGACSCEVKSLNPGIDILMTADWDSSLGESWIEDIPLPPLVSIADLKPVGDSKTEDNANETTSAAVAAQNDAADLSEGSGSLKRNIGLSLGAVIIVVMLLSFTVGRKKTGSNR